MATRTVGSGQYYSDLIAWESGEQGTYTDEDVIADCYGSSVLIPSSTRLSISGYTLNGTSKVVVRAAAGQRNPTSAFSTSYAYVDDTGGASNSFQGLIRSTVELWWDGVQIDLQREGVDTRPFGSAPEDGIWCTRTLIKGAEMTINEDGHAAWTHQNQSYSGAFINCVIDGFFTLNSLGMGIGQFGNAIGGSIWAVGCTIVNCDIGTEVDGSDVGVVNCRIGLCNANNFLTTSGSFLSGSDYNRSDDATDTGGANDVASAAMNFANAGADDYSLTSNDQNGQNDLSFLTQLPSYIDTSIDYVGNARSNYNPGAFEFTSGASIDPAGPFNGDQGHVESFPLTSTGWSDETWGVQAPGLPSGLTLQDNGDGTADIDHDGTCSAGTYVRTVTLGSATREITITIDPYPTASMQTDGSGEARFPVTEGPTAQSGDQHTIQVTMDGVTKTIVRTKT